jgi:16S rRNA (guanine1516-N2)-methyltransferase
VANPLVPTVLAVVAVDEEQEDRARALAAQLNLDALPVGTVAAHCESHAALLLCAEQGLLLQQTGKRAPGPIGVAFGDAAMRHRRRGGQNELLGKAVGVGKKPEMTVLDATAGLGRDAFVLADLGCSVIMCEREPVIAQMLSAALENCRKAGDVWLHNVAQRMQLIAAEASESAADMNAVDVICLDPMFPERRKSAAVKKEMGLFQELFHRPDWQSDGDSLLLWALAQPVARVVVKRPSKAEFLAGQKPAHQISGKSVRFDVYVLSAIS